jgi:hypothetical protein
MAWLYYDATLVSVQQLPVIGRRQGAVSLDGVDYFSDAGLYAWQPVVRALFYRLCGLNYFGY